MAWATGSLTVYPKFPEWLVEKNAGAVFPLRQRVHQKFRQLQTGFQPLETNRNCSAPQPTRWTNLASTAKLFVSHCFSNRMIEALNANVALLHRG